MNQTTPRNLDHIVMPVSSLEVARERFELLGFSVAPDGRHSFGTENCCIKFADGTFLEPLAIGHRETVEAHLGKGNNFLRRDAAYRFRHGNEGFWGISLSSNDAAEDRRAFKAAGYTIGKLVQVKRKGVHAKLAFALDERAPDFSLFCCQDMVNAPATNSDLVQHKNGGQGITRVIACEQLPEDFQYYLQTVTGQREVRSHSFGMEIKLSNARFSVLNPSGMRAHFGVETPSARGLRAMAVDIAVKDLETVSGVLQVSGIKSRKIGHRVIVDPAPGQGAIIAFAEDKN